ncbi:hypothetical protein NS365_21440 [Aureimonas ureilytica]|uniref:Uncharacterized protein n=1 Tax=Aureimonas ureilytica TaxID=401562 RepID=A0A175RIG7_9HYPH|nr:hypothetical protein [Aureimonas ureilytica]KTR02552.1 hypothetical protein NS365_21440 [Aureimonas ureilytica]
MNAIVDLSAFVPTDTALLEILAPGGVNGTGWTITFAGPSHPKAVAYAEENSRKNLRRQRQIEAAQINNRKFKPEEREVDEVRRENVAWIVARILDWTPVKLGPGGPVAFSEEAAFQMLLDPNYGWVFAQVVEFMTDERSFTKGSAKTSDASPSATSNSD